MKSLRDRVVAIRTGGGTERCHGIRHHGTYSVAEHTWGVLCLLYVLWPQHYASLSPIILFHDVPEAWVGDIPATTKTYEQAVKEACDRLELRILNDLDLPNDQSLSYEELRIYKACDHLELYLWAMEQVLGGNEHARCIMRQLDRFFDDKPLLAPADALHRALQAGGPACVERATDGVIMNIASGGARGRA